MTSRLCDIRDKTVPYVLKNYLLEICISFMLMRILSILLPLRTAEKQLVDLQVMVELGAEEETTRTSFDAKGS